MRLPRMTTRRWMVAVAVVALACATTVLVMDRKKRFTRISWEHAGAFPPLSFVDLIVATESERERLGAWGQRVTAWHKEMAQKYHYASRHPWLPVEPDPPEPKWIPSGASDGP